MSVGRSQSLVPWIYDILLGIFSICLDIFFREVYPRGAWRIPKREAVIIVAAPHANQFVDSVLLMCILKQHAGRQVSFLTAEKSLREPYIGRMAAWMGALPVVRPMDHASPGQGVIYLPDPDNNPALVCGRGASFTSLTAGCLIILPKVGNVRPEQQTVAQILGPQELLLRGPFSSAKPGHPLRERLLTGTPYKIAPHVDQREMFDAVFRELADGGCIGIFPEGGSHDRPSLLPLKAGVAIIALGTLARTPNCNLTILPCGLNYFNPNKFRSRAVVEFGNPVQVHPGQVDAFKEGGEAKRNAVGSLLETIQDALAAVTQQAPDHETLMLIQATRRLYRPLRMKLPLPLVVEMNRRLIAGYTNYKDDVQVIQLRKAVLDYNRKLRALGIKDHQLEWGDAEHRSWWLALLTLVYRVGQLITLGIATLPSLALFWPVFVTTKVISVKKQRKALAASDVKLEGRDVVGTWKILVALGLAPTLYTWYTSVVTLWLHHGRHNGYYVTLAPWYIRADAYVPRSAPLWVFSTAFFALLIAITFAGLRIGEIGVDIIQSLPPLFAALSPGSARALAELRTERQALSARVVKVIDTFEPELFADLELDSMDLDNHEYHYDGTYESELKVMPFNGNETPERGRCKARERLPRGLG
ncbi:glycerol-3-phosphate acyltransferase Sct1 [Westerdykella ornata]|uniref:Glycerol-3-phosphate acyltransferase Sct1 n=1 Tax=Westerdykella ornata TaxID=318751 RepID=A0A6A6J4K6_WESOR|nr:glycerol-3-phosphate acyltransferase Sct1 [Westerdykella ornata]KAF2271511.1 glycerol-3-phosphate acyltransferase Sct1 [Westerdykella ornata]